jgi:hypothetical protein
MEAVSKLGFAKGVLRVTDPELSGAARLSPGAARPGFSPFMQNTFVQNSCMTLSY